MSSDHTFHMAEWTPKEPDEGEPAIRVSAESLRIGEDVTALLWIRILDSEADEQRVSLRIEDIEGLAAFLQEQAALLRSDLQEKNRIA